jgi:phenylpyruvate tautomerase PptA (4-oxalocrotonate tautomerase family)
MLPDRLVSKIPTNSPMRSRYDQQSCRYEQCRFERKLPYPPYTVTSVEGCLDAPKRAKIASKITHIHSETTGAPTYFAQIIFTEVEEERLGLHHRSRAAAIDEKSGAL